MPEEWQIMYLRSYRLSLLLSELRQRCKSRSPGAWLPYGGVHYAACSLPASVAVITCYLFYKQSEGVSTHDN